MAGSPCAGGMPPSDLKKPKILKKSPLIWTPNPIQLDRAVLHGESGPRPLLLLHPLRKGDAHGTRTSHCHFRRIEPH